MFKLSRYWNMFIFYIIRKARLMIWDYTKKNVDILGFLDREIEDNRESLTYISKKRD